MDEREATAAGAPAGRRDELRRGLSRRAERVARAALEALLADEDEAGHLVPPPRSTCDRGVDWLSHATGGASPDLRLTFGFLTLLLQLLPLFAIGVPRRMTSLSLADRIRYLEALEASRIGLLAMLVVAFKVPLCMAALEEGDELRSTGFDRPSTTSRRVLPVVPPDGPRAEGEAA
jgi:hypothetical protein